MTPAAPDVTPHPPAQVYNLLLPLLRKKVGHGFLLDALLVARQASPNPYFVI